MRALKVYVTTDEQPEVYFFHWKNNLLSFENEKFYFDSKFKKEREEINFKMVKINFSNLDNNFNKYLYKLYQKSMEEAQKLAKEPIGLLKKNMSHKSVIDSTVMKYTYKSDKIIIFEFICDLFINLLMRHVLTNGNKRTALVFLKLLLKDWGYYLKWTEGFYKNYHFHKDNIESFVSRMESNNTKLVIAETKKEIFQWIIKNVNIGLYWKYG